MIRHMGKERMLREGILPDRVQASEAAIASYNFVMHQDSGDNAANAANDQTNCFLELCDYNFANSFKS